ncbi:hypothetical protein V865_004262 [Kwoniella europaea PYCC6329]|uniref:Uncharacterized protein n=1 Tax=Kwoniella europaea PYCC6329 TaxID=1423913 RepID=A0AAX4KIH5_9TREE
MSQPKTRSDHPYGAKPPYVPPPGPFYSQASMSQNESSAFPGSSSFPPSRSAENTRRPSRPVGAFVDANEEVLPNIPGRSGFPSGPVHTNPPGRIPSHHDVQSRQQAELQIRQQANTHHQYEANAQSQLHQDQHHAEYPIQGRTHSSNRSQPSRPDHGSSSGFPAVGAGQAPLKPALKKTQPSSAEDFIKIKQENIDQSPAMVQPTRGYTSVIENTYILPKASPIQERSTHEHPQHQSSNSDPRQLKRESSMPPLGRSSFYEEQEEDVQSTAYDTPEPRGRRRTGRQDQRTDSKPTLGTSVKMGRSKSVINEGGSQRNNVRSSAYQAQDQGERQEFSPSENASFYNPDNEFGSIHQSIEEVLYSARDHYDELRIKEQWYPRAIGCRDQEIARLVGTNGELEQRVRGLIAAKARSEANAKREVEKAHAKVKIEMQHKSEVERVSKESREKLNELLRDEDVQAMKNFKEQQIAPLNSSVEVLGTSLAGIRTAFNEIKDDIALSSKMKDDLDDVREENKRLKSALSQQESENTKLQTKVNQYESSVGQSLQKVDDYVANLNSAKSSDEASLKILVERNITLNEKVQQTEKELTKMQLELAKLQSTIESYETLTQESLDFFRDKGLEGDDIKDMLAQLGTKHQSQLQEAKDENKKQYENLKFRYDKGIQLLETLQKEHDEMTKQMEENQAVFEERDRLSQKVIDFRDKVKQLESTINALQAEKGRAEERCGEYLGQVQEMKTRCAQLEETITNLQSRVEARDNQDLKELKNDIKALGQHIKNGGRSDGVAESEVVAKVKEDLRACRQELDNTIVELQELRNKPQEHVEAAVQRYKAGTSTASEIRLHDWAEEGQKKNDMKSHLARIEKLEKDGATKDKEIEALRQSVSSASSKPATAPSIPQSPHLSTTPGIARSTAKEPNPKKRHLNLYPPTDKPNPPPASQKRLRVEKTQQDDDHYFDEINDSDLPDPAEYGKEATDKAKGKQLKDVTMVLDGNDQSSELSEDELESTQPASSSQQPPHSQAVDTTKHRQGRPSNAKNAKFTTKASASKASTSRSKSIPDKENDDDDWTPPGEKGAKKGDKNDRKNGKK